MSEWSEKNSSQTSLSTLWLCKPFGLKKNKFVINFRENSKKFIIGILTKNIALNLSGALFFIGIGYSLKWWYKDQLFLILLKQNLPVFSESENKISWETGEYALNQIKEQQKRLAGKKKNVATFHIFDMTSVPSSALSVQSFAFQEGGKTHKPVENYLVEEDFNNSKHIPSLASIDKDAFFNSDVNVKSHEVLEFNSKAPSFCLKQPIQDSKKVKDTISYLSPVGIQFAKQLGVRYDLIDRIDLYTNQIVVKLKQPWQKHVYQRFIGIFAQSNPSTSSPKEEVACGGREESALRFLQTKGLRPKEEENVRSSSEGEVPIIYDNISSSPNPVSGLANLKAIPTTGQLHIVSNSEGEKDTKFRDCSSEKRTKNFLTADRGLEGQEKFSIYTRWKQLFPKTWFKLSARSFCFLNQELSPAPTLSNPLSSVGRLGVTKLKGISPYAMHTPYKNKFLMYPEEKGHKELNLLKPTVLLFSSVNVELIPGSSNKNNGILDTKFTKLREFISPTVPFSGVNPYQFLMKRQQIIRDKIVTTLGSTCFSEKPWYSNATNELTALGKLSYPLELTKTLTGWQPSIDVLILNSYLDEIPYKLENVLQPYFPKKDSELLSLSTSFIKSINYVDKDKSSIIPSLILPLKRSNLSIQEKTNNSSNLNAPLSLNRTESINFLQSSTSSMLEESQGALLPSYGVQSVALQKEDNSMQKKYANDQKKVVVSESYLKKSQLFEIKQLLKNELQSLINTLPLAVIDQFFFNEYLQEEKKNVADVTTNVLGVKTLRDLTKNTPPTSFNEVSEQSFVSEGKASYLQTPLKPSVDLFYGAKKKKSVHSASYRKYFFSFNATSYTIWYPVLLFAKHRKGTRS